MISRSAVAALLDEATPLHAAALRGNPAQIDHLLFCKADPMARTAAGDYPFELVPKCDDKPSGALLVLCTDAVHLQAMSHLTLIVDRLHFSAICMVTCTCPCLQSAACFSQHVGFSKTACVNGRHYVLPVSHQAAPSHKDTFVGKISFHRHACSDLVQAGVP